MNNKNLVPVETIAKLFNVTTRWVQRLAKDEAIPKPERGKYHFIGCIQQYIKFLQERLKGKDADSVDGKKEKARLTKLQADEKEIKILTEKGLLIPVNDVQDTLSELISICAMGLESIPGRMAGQLAGITAPAEIQQVLFEEIRRIRQSMASGIQKLAGSESNIDSVGGNNGRAATTKSRRVGGKKPDIAKRKRGTGADKVKKKNSIHD